MDFGVQPTTTNKMDISQKREEIRALVYKFVNSNNFDQRLIFQSIIDLLGKDNVDDQMLSFAVRLSIEKIQKIKSSQKPNKAEIDKAINLIVEWALIKLKARWSIDLNTSGDQIEIGSNRPD